MKPAVQKVQTAIAEHGLEREIIELAVHARTSQQAADALGVTVGQIVKSLVFTADDRPLLVAVSGVNRVDERRLGELAGGRIRRADPDTVKFYTDALGFEVSRRHTSPRGAQLVFLKTPNSEEEIELCQLPNSPSVQVQPDLMHLAFEVDDLTAFAAALQKKGYTLSDGPTPTGAGSMIAFIDAPEGYEVELIQRGK